MANMSYCRFENTARDLRDCIENMENEVSEREHKHRERLITMCHEVAENWAITDAKHLPKEND